MNLLFSSKANTEGIKMSVTAQESITISKQNKLAGLFQVGTAAADLIASLKTVRGIRVSWSYLESDQELRHKVIGEGSEEDEDSETLEEIFSMMKLLESDMHSLNGRALQVTIFPA